MITVYFLKDSVSNTTKSFLSASEFVTEILTVVGIHGNFHESSSNDPLIKTWVKEMEFEDYNKLPSNV